MTKFLLLVLVIVAVLWGPLSRLRGPARPAPSRPDPRDPSSASRASTTPQDIVPCAHCGLHLPRGDAIAGPEHGRGAMFCSAEHRRLGPRTGAA